MSGTAPKVEMRSKDPEAELAAMREAHTALGKRIDEMSGGKKPDARRKDDAGDLSEVIKAAVAAGIREGLAQAKPEDGAEEEAEGEAVDDDRPRRRKRRARAHDDDDRDPKAGEPEETAADDTKVAEAQQRADSVALLHGRRADRPRIRESSYSYRRRLIQQLASLSPRHRGVNPFLVDDPKAFDELENAVLAAVRASAYDPQFNTQPGQLREVRRRDATGREFIEFVGSMDWLNQFSYPPQKATFNRRRIERAEDRLARGEKAP